VKILTQEIFLKKIGARIKALRKEQQISQSQLAFEAELPLRQIGRIERGELNTGVHTLYKISHALNVQLKDLIEE
jgi:transcriptional regulator with XRE-family HTH domain